MTIEQTLRPTRVATTGEAAPAPAAAATPARQAAQPPRPSLDGWEVCAGTCAQASTCGTRAQMLARRDAHRAALQTSSAGRMAHVEIAYEGQTSRPAPAAPAKARMAQYLSF